MARRFSGYEQSQLRVLPGALTAPQDFAELAKPSGFSAGVVFEAHSQTVYFAPPERQDNFLRAVEMMHGAIPNFCEGTVGVIDVEGQWKINLLLMKGKHRASSESQEEAAGIILSAINHDFLDNPVIVALNNGPEAFGWYHPGLRRLILSDQMPLSTLDK